MKPILRCCVAALVGVSAVSVWAEAAPEIDLQDMSGAHHKLSDYRGRVVLLNFWATYCVPCATEMPLLAEMQKRYKGKLVVIAASVDDPEYKAEVKQFLRKHKVEGLSVMLGPSLDTLTDFGLDQALPGTVYIEANGNIAGRKKGALKRAELEQKLKEMLGAPEPPIRKKSPDPAARTIGGKIAP